MKADRFTHSFDPNVLQRGDSRWCENCGARISFGFGGFTLWCDPMGRDQSFATPPPCAGRLEILRPSILN